MRRSGRRDADRHRRTPPAVADEQRPVPARLRGPEGERRGLRVSFYLSHSGRRINNRVYSVWGQRAGIDKLTQPYAKPILLDHEREVNKIIGRFTGGRYEDLSEVAVQRFGRIQDFIQIQQASEARDWEKYADLLHRSRILLDSKWQGFGRMHVEARITDQAAIEKFLDGTYLTFSGGADTDAMVCSHCFANWRATDICEHMPGTIVDGKPVVHLVGSYDPNEGSVVTHPANELSVVTSMDSAPAFMRDSAFQTDPTTIYLTDSIYQTEDPVEKENETTQAPEQTTEVTPEVTDTQAPEVEVQPPAEVLTKEQVWELVREAIRTAKDEILASLPQPETAPAVESQPVTDEAQETTPITDTRYEDLKGDYTEALNQTAQLRDQLGKVLDYLATQHGKDFGEIELADKASVMFEWFEGLEAPAKPATTLKPVQNPSVTSSDYSQENPTRQLGEREQKVVSNYKKIFDERGEGAAEFYLNGQRRYLPPKFHPKNYITVGE